MVVFRGRATLQRAADFFSQRPSPRGVGGSSGSADGPEAQRGDSAMGGERRLPRSPGSILCVGSFGALLGQRIRPNARTGHLQVSDVYETLPTMRDRLSQHLSLTSMPTPSHAAVILTNSSTGHRNRASYQPTHDPVAPDLRDTAVGRAPEVNRARTVTQRRGC